MTGKTPTPGPTEHRKPLPGAVIVSSELYVGLMSGTSLDAIDAALISIADDRVELLHTAEAGFPEQLRNRLLNLIREPDHVSLDHLGEVDRQLGLAYADAVKQLLVATATAAADIAAIGCHGQTIRHAPDSNPPFTLQIGDAATLATATGITVISDFRSADMALGGQGAPLAPAFHQFAFAAADRQRVVVNIGGIANITLLQPGAAVTGYDTGPGNTLLDLWCEQHLAKRYDADGAWASDGEVDTLLLDTMLADPYFSQPPPKSTGREYFNDAWLQRYLDSLATGLKPVDVQATLLELTARSVAAAVTASSTAAEIYLCGGGAHNTLLAERIAANLAGRTVATTAELGLAADWVEAAAFAWLARARLHNTPVDLSAVTGAARPALLGCITAA